MDTENYSGRNQQALQEVVPHTTRSSRKRSLLIITISTGPGEDGRVANILALLLGRADSTAHPDCGEEGLEFERVRLIHLLATSANKLLKAKSK